MTSKTSEPKLSPADIAALRPETRLVHGGILRSPFGETAEAMYLTQGYVYESAEQAEARFKGDDPGFIYTRYSNPTVAMFETRLALLEGAEVTAAMPVAVARAASAPSSSRMRSSNMPTVGFEKRE